MTKRYFAYDPETGFETFATEQEAINFANEVIDDYRDNAGEGWDEMVEQVCWGEINQVALMTGQQPAPTESEFDYTCDYALGDLPAIDVRGNDGDGQPYSPPLHVLLEALESSLAAMEHMGDTLNELDAVTEEDEVHYAAFEKVRAAIAAVTGKMAASPVSDDAVKQALAEHLNGRCQGSAIAGVDLMDVVSLCDAIIHGSTKHQSLIRDKAAVLREQAARAVLQGGSPH